MTPRLSRKQADSLVNATARVNAWSGAVSSGKTLMSVLAWANYLAHDAPRAGRPQMIGRTLDTLYRNVLSLLTDPEISGPIARDVHYTRGANQAVIFEREVDVLGASDVRAESRIRGVTSAGWYVDEGTLLPDHAYWQQLLNRLRVPGARGFVTTNPDGPQHWFKTHVLDRADELGYNAWHFELDDNPALDPDYVTSVKAENTGVFYERNILGLWVLAEGMIWQAFDRDRHVVDKLPPGLNGHLIGVDHGTTNPFAALVIARGIDPADGQERLWVTGEYRHDSRSSSVRKTDSEYAADLAQFIARPDQVRVDQRTVEVYVDPSAAGFTEQLYRDRWDNAGAAHNDVSAGLSLVASLFALDRIRIHRSCIGLLSEIPGYVWDPKASKKGNDAPHKVNDHSCDALRYGVWGHWRAWERWLTQPIAIPADVRR